MKFKEEKNPKSFGGNISREELAKHYKKTDCWTALEGKVYDITKYIQFHPGGKKILLGAGKDGTEAFKKYHAWVNYEFILAKYFVGVLE